MNEVAKLVIVDEQDKYLLLYRNNHPYFGNDPDLPGGTLEVGEQPLAAMIREVREEAGIDVSGVNARLLQDTTSYSKHGTRYVLYTAKLKDQPEVVLSWEHASFEWMTRDNFLQKIKSAKDTFLHMVYDAVVADR